MNYRSVPCIHECVHIRKTTLSNPEAKVNRTCLHCAHKGGKKEQILVLCLVWFFCSYHFELFVRLCSVHKLIFVIRRSQATNYSILWVHISTESVDKMRESSNDVSKNSAEKEKRTESHGCE